MKIPSFIKPLDIEKQRDEIIEEFKQKSKKLDYIPLVGDDYMTLIDIFLYRQAKFIEYINYQISNNYLNFSTGEYLDELVALIGLKRFDEVKPVAKLKIAVSSPTYLPKGTKFTDLKGHNAYLLHNLSLNDETKEYIATIELETHSKAQFEFTHFEVPNIYIKRISSDVPFSGAKRAESDDELRNRFLLSLHRFSTAGSKKSYLFYVLNTESITKANVYQKGAGEVAIIYQGLLENSILEDKIMQNLKDRVPLTDKISLKPVNLIKFDLNITIEVKNELLLSEAITNAYNAIKKYFNALKISENVHESKVIDIAFQNDENILKVFVNSTIPKISRDDILVLNELKITKALNV